MIESLFQSSNYNALKQMMDVTATRHRALAGNVANVDTPGYRRVDIAPTFEAELAARIKAGAVSPQQAVRSVPVEEDRETVAMRPDGNNVSLDRELMLINQNALTYEALGQFVSGSLSRLKTAISGRVQ